jgi:hypothetical protein
MLLNIGDLVLWHNTHLQDAGVRRKFSSKNYGPFKIVGRIGDKTFKLKNLDTGAVLKEPVSAKLLIPSKMNLYQVPQVLCLEMKKRLWNLPRKNLMKLFLIHLENHRVKILCSNRPRSLLKRNPSQNINLIWLPKRLTTSVIKQIHEGFGGGHVGFDKTYKS